MNILITGSSGFIGSHLTKQLKKKHQVTLSDTTQGRSRLKNLGDFKNLTTKKLKGYDAVIRLAWSSTPAQQLTLSQEKKININPTEELFIKAEAARVNKLVFMSSAGAIYGRIQPPFTETNIPKPISSYGKAKLEVEQFLTKLTSKFTQPLIFRATNAIGFDQRVNKGQGLIPAIFNHLQEEKEFTLWGNSKKDYLVVADLIDAMVLGLEKEAQGIFNLGSGQIFSTTDIINLIEIQTGKKLIFSSKPIQRFDVNTVMVNSEKAERDFGWKAKRKVESVIKKLTKKLLK